MSSYSTAEDDKMPDLPPRGEELALMRRMSQRFQSRMNTDVTDVFDHLSHHKYNRCVIIYRNDHFHGELIDSARGIRELLQLREKYILTAEEAPAVSSSDDNNNNDDNDVKGAEDWSKVTCRMEKGVMRVYNDKSVDLCQSLVPNVTEFNDDLKRVWTLCKHPKMKTITHKRLEVMLRKYEMYMTLNSLHEVSMIKKNNMDLYSVGKIDNHIHLAASITAKMLLAYIVQKFHDSPNAVVDKHPKTGENVTLSELFSELEIDASLLSIDDLNVQANETMFHRFDHFNAGYNPFGEARLRKVFLKTNNVQNGLYFAELTQGLFKRLERQANNVYLEPRLSIYGTSMQDWAQLARWVGEHKLHSSRVRWIVQVPRVYEVFRGLNKIESIQEQLCNIFQPLFDVTLAPESNKQLTAFLEHVVAFDSVDDESSFDELTVRNMRTPDEWKDTQKPSYSYWMYYMWANIRTLNELRRKHGMNTFAFRPHCGESGPAHHLASAFLVANNVNHGIQLSSVPVLQYMYYITQIPLAVSPLSNNSLFTKLQENPFHDFFKKGLNVSLSTDDPMQFHSTQEPLMEEYTIAKQTWNLSVTCLSEIARNSVIASGFPDSEKKSLLGPQYKLDGVHGNNPRFTNIPMMRVDFRTETLHSELQFLWKASVTGEHNQEALFARSPRTWKQLSHFQPNPLTILH